MNRYGEKCVRVQSTLLPKGNVMARPEAKNRPPHLDPVDPLPPSPPVPEPEPISEERKEELAGSPVRYGDWEHEGICWDF